MDKTNLMTIEELSEIASKLLSENKSQDKRYSSGISVRRIRDYLTKGMLDKPYKDGKTSLYGEQHLKKLLSLRELQSEGLSDQYMKKISETPPVKSFSSDIDMQSDALFLINSISSDASSFSGNTSLINAKSLMGNYYQNNEPKKFNALSDMTPTSKIWQEFQVDDAGKFFLKIEQGASAIEAEKMLQNIKTILNIK